MTKVREELEAAHKKAQKHRRNPCCASCPATGTTTTADATSLNTKWTTGLSAEELNEITARLTTYPADFHIHPKVKKLLEQRAEMGTGKRLVDYGMAEALALRQPSEGRVPVRLSGQDSRRGTFNQRHSVLSISRTSRNTFRCRTSPKARRAARSTTPRFPKPA